MIRRAGAPSVLLFVGLAALAGAWTSATGVTAQAPASQEPAAPGTYRPPPAPVQPIAYSHKQHLAQGLDCAACHVTSRTDSHATLPPTATCMGCHATVKTDSAEIQKLKDFDVKKEDVPWKRVYRLADYVYFSHKVHVASDPSITCETCHGNVRELDVMQKLKDISMAACVECHKQHAATIRCDGCHEPRGH
jgi:hypothetical protein